ncbi:TolC family protein [Flaviaesturariibacter amylovorans]|uniref:TolC family protein n=1 Tax=Flaviaesturariibacter amylovorans TaxID=1084520 RepID=A0ABP8GRM7_9BACT
MRTSLLILLLALFGPATAQTVFRESELLAVVREQHPVARVARTEVAVARAGLLSRRGAFDPVIGGSSNQKDLVGTTYYDRWQTELKVPTWYGIDVTAGLEEARGSRLNPEVTPGALSYVGVSVPLGQRLLFDKRRAALRTAQVLVEASEAARREALNNLLYDALTAYWHWWEAYTVLQQSDSALDLAAQRLRMVRTYVQLGDRAALDTVEAATQVQAFAFAREEALLRLQKARLELAAYLWKDGTTPVELPSDAVPQLLSPGTPPPLNDLQQLLPDHPGILQYRFKLQALRIDRRLKFQSLLPEVDLKYQWLYKGHDIGKTFNAPLLANDYRFGLRVSVPLRLSEGRGAWQAARLKLQQAELEAANKQVQLLTKLRQYDAEWLQTGRLLTQQQALLNSYVALQRGEELRFRNGDGSLFLVNAREQKTWEARRKVAELQAKKERARISVIWAAGRLPG